MLTAIPTSPAKIVVTNKAEERRPTQLPDSEEEEDINDLIKRIELEFLANRRTQKQRKAKSNRKKKSAK